MVRDSRSCPDHVVPKKMDASGKVKWRLVSYFRRLNDRIIEHKYPLPNINNILDGLGHAQYFTSLNFARGYHHVQMYHRDVEKIVFFHRKRELRVFAKTLWLKKCT